MNGVRKRRFPVIVASCSILVLVVSVVTAQQVFDRNRQPAFVRRQTIFQQQQPNQIQFQQNRNFVLPSASPLRQRNLFTRQISHRHRPRQRSSLKSSRTTTHPAHLTTRRVIPTLSHKRTRSRTGLSSFFRTKPNVTTRVTSSNQRTTTIKSNISRRQPFIQRQQQFRFQPQRVQRVQTFQRGGSNQNAQFVMRPGVPRSPFAIRAPLSPMPFGSVQRTPSSLRRPVSPNRSSLRPPLPPQSPSPSTQILTTTTPIPSTTPPTSPVPTTTQPVSLPSTTHVATVHSVGGSLRRPIRVQQLQLNLRRKPQMTRGQFRRPNSKNFPLTRHQPTHRVTKPDRVTRPIVSTTTLEPTTTSEDVSFTVAGTTPEGIQTQQSELKKVDDIEAAILQAVIESSSPEPPPSSTTHRPRIHRIRPGHRHRPESSPPRVDAIEEAVLRAVLEATPASPPSEDVTTTPMEETTTTTLATAKTEETTTQKPESTSLFPAFASRRHGHRRPTTVIPRTMEVTTEPTTTESTTTELATTTKTDATTTTSEESTTAVTEGTTTEQVTGITIALPKEDFEDINAKTETVNHQLNQIEKNVISALSTPTTSSDSSSPSPPSPLPPIPTSSPVPPSPPAPPHEFASLQAGPPGSMPPSDDIVDELNGSSDFLQVAQRLHLLRRLLQ
ncbi:hypothetical protein L5515_000542 [Caenorhabditis briggsae]|uniref:Protein CBR-PQN-72 n=1 Tax=Caenorhabditis briggsae TaxID=6238 RepID=A0AAE9DZR9_CAEBR|nr:hypothetical protein L5515_000542 [Caenorhabditis briggsae]